MKRIAIIDDELDARQSLRTLLNTFCPDVNICGEANSVESAYALIRQTSPTGILLDISMEDGTGFDLLDKFPNPSFQVIFTTAHDEFALKAFRYHALDYLLKPINPVELAQAIDRINDKVPQGYSTQIDNLLQSTRTGELGKITLTSQEGMFFLHLHQITHLQSDGSYTIFYLKDNERHIISRPIKDFEELLPHEHFFRVHQSHLINLTCVKKILREDGGYALLNNGSKIPIARRRKEEFLDTMRQRFSL